MFSMKERAKWDAWKAVEGKKQIQEMNFFSLVICDSCPKLKHFSLLWGAIFELSLSSFCL